ncbi:hypothetical protein [Furfurilactobacillus entadae]|uniref:hypothetical protein n=1 Tax=Furfurilactobacillus entadae TaxID=2922307 RepID=UPI0035E58F2E
MEISDVVDDLVCYAYSEDINVIWSDELDENTPSVVSTKLRTIIMNDKVGRDVAMELAHEISHIENGDDETAILPFSAAKEVDYGIEHDANLCAIDMLLPYYLEDFEIDPTQINVMGFMRQFGIPLHFENYIREKISKTYAW